MFRAVGGSHGALGQKLIGEIGRDPGFRAAGNTWHPLEDAQVPIAVQELDRPAKIS
ncbi:hypothetical protein OG864_48755 [Streptomyces sp. NBC_00124]|uniref:hypothetical protein n=1 Tax=Streptomyces sp. NBC_00124 TaxID=2975662 RepID=UPI002254F34B|nr:hypothetical protein [Streptomyces sp. NBC_00124]MCX5366593.1 hypothetical protein [Streptomyces sp. NBC_00124]